MKIMKILNLYAGIGGNRKLWGAGLDITAVEWDEKIAAIYADLWPEDKVVVGDAHQYLLDHYSEFDFIWSSPPCQTHSITNHFLHAQGVIRYPDMALWQEVIFLKHFFGKTGGKWVVENVKSYYDPLIQPQVSGRHYFWANFKIPKMKGVKVGRMGPTKIGQEMGLPNNGRTEGYYSKELGFGVKKQKYLNNCVTPEIGLAIFQAAQGIYQESRKSTGTLFSENGISK